MPPTPFVISHLSDLHLTRQDHLARSEPDLFSPLKGMNAAFRDLVTSPEVRGSQLLLVTGDVTDRGDLESWQVFWRGVAEAGLSKKTLVVPGNHDMCCLGLRLPFKTRLYRARDFEKAAAGLARGRQPTRFPWARVVDPRLVIFGLSSNNLGNATATSNAMGEIGYFQLERLARLLFQYRNVPVKIVALHHSPNIPEKKTAKKRGLPTVGKLSRLGHQIPQDQRRALRLLCLTHRVRLIVHGHLHIAEDRRVGGVRMIGAPASTEPDARDDRGAALEYFQYTIKGDGEKARLFARRRQLRSKA